MIDDPEGTGQDTYCGYCMLNIRWDRPFSRWEHWVESEVGQIGQAMSWQFCRIQGATEAHVATPVEEVDDAYEMPTRFIDVKPIIGRLESIRAELLAATPPTGPTSMKGIAKWHGKILGIDLALEYLKGKPL